MNAEKPQTGLSREIGLLGLAATGICSMIGAGINIVPIMIQRNVPGIGPYVLPAYVLASVPAVLAALAYAVLASAMPRAGGSYVYASRAVSPYIGFIASFSQWFGLCMGIGVVSYVVPPFLRDIATALEWKGVADSLDVPIARLALALIFLWVFVLVNLRGLQLYTRTLVVLMILMFAGGGVVVFAGWTFDHADFAAAILRKYQVAIPAPVAEPFKFTTLLAAAAILFSSFIGFDSIAQAGGEARDPDRALPKAIGISMLTVGTFYMLFSGAVYHAVPWEYIAEEANTHDLTAPGLLGNLLSPGWTVIIVSGAAFSLINDLPAMLLAVSRLMFAWAEDGIFPRAAAHVHAKHRIPDTAILLSALMATAGILGNFFASDFFLGVDILVLSMLVNFLLMCLSVLVLPWTNPGINERIGVVRSGSARMILSVSGILVLGTFLTIHIGKDISAVLPAWYYHSSVLWLVVMSVATLIYIREVAKLRQKGVDVKAIFAGLPPE